MELRHGVPQLPPTSVAVRDIVRALPLGLYFDMLAMRLNGSKADGLQLRLNWRITDTGECALLNLEHCALTHRLGETGQAVDASVAMDRATLDDIALQKLALPDALASGRVQVQGRADALLQLMALQDSFSRMFPLVGPRPAAGSPSP
jgi:alkyl sulfatase BDS1-like metallo-beta-lactamase superfamily hydrolase